MTATTVSIGRNVGDDTLSDEAWSDFREAVLDQLDHAGLDIVFAGRGQGYWTPEDGDTVEEEAFTAVALGSPRFALAPRFAALARQYGQEAIAVTTGETHLVTAAQHLAVTA